jgi:ubiquinone/menaquinone biosynthesis C-methylase UbiE
MTAPKPPSDRGGHHDHRRMHELVWTREQAEAMLDDPARQRLESPRELWARAGLRKGMTVVDVGAGSGHFTFPASEIVGETGRVYAVDVSRELVGLLKERVRTRRRPNVVPVLSRPGRIPLADEVADRVLLANVVHGIPPATLEEAVRVLRPGGRLLDLDWKKKATVGGPPVDHRLSVAEARAAFEARDLRTLGHWNLGPAHYLLVLRKPAGRAAER